LFVSRRFERADRCADTVRDRHPLPRSRASKLAQGGGNWDKCGQGWHFDWPLPVHSPIGESSHASTPLHHRSIGSQSGGNHAQMAGCESPPAARDPAAGGHALSRYLRERTCAGAWALGHHVQSRPHAQRSVSSSREAAGGPGRQASCTEGSEVGRGHRHVWASDPGRARDGRGPVLAAWHASSDSQGG
jgi:hypothetical protein